MSSSTPSDPSQHEPTAPDDNVPEPVPDEADTGPLQTVSPDESVNRRWDSDPQWVDPAPARQGTWAGRFDAPLTVSPRQMQRQRNPKPFLIGAAVAVGAVVVVGGVIFWITRPSADSAQPPNPDPTTSASPAPSANPEAEARLQRQLPQGYAADSCETAQPPEGLLAQLNCQQNTDAGGPLSATYTLAGDRAALDSVFNANVAAATQVNCPGNIQSPGPWRRNATPDRISGQLFCGLRDGQPTVVWTDVERMTVSAVRAGPQGPTFPQLYAWWSSHS